MAEIQLHFVDASGNHFVAPFPDQVAAASYVAPVGATQISAPPGSDYVWQNGAWVQYVPTVSTDPKDYPLQRYQFTAMLDIAGITAQVEAGLNAISDPVQKAVAWAKYRDTQVFQYDDPLIASVAALAGITTATMVSLWLQAKDL